MFKSIKVEWSEVFGANVKVPAKAPKLTKRVWSVKNNYIPKLNDGYSFRFDLGMRKLMMYLETGRGQKPWIFGPHGSGKTSTPNQIAARLGRVIREEYVSETTEATDLLGQWVPNESGGLTFKEGILVQAMRNGEWVLINEFDLLDAREQKRLNALFEENTVTLPSGEKLVASSEFRLIVTANTNGTGDNSGDYSNVAQGDSSVGDRFFFIEMDYISREDELNILLNVAKKEFQAQGMTKENVDNGIALVKAHIVEHFLDYATNLRNSHKKYRIGDQTGLPVAISTRTMIEWMRQTIEEMAWIDNAKPNALGSSLKDCVTSSLQHSFVLGQKPELHHRLVQFFEDKSGGSFSAF